MDTLDTARLHHKRFLLRILLSLSIIILIDWGVLTAAAEPRLQRQPSAWDYALVGGAFGGTILLQQFVSPPPRFKGGILLDDSLREVVRAREGEGRGSADRISNVTIGMAMAAPFVLGAGLQRAAIEGEGVQAYRFGVLGAQVLGVTLLATEVTKVAVGRERPDAGADANRSFFSGHSSMAFSAAGLLCQDHFRRAKVRQGTVGAVGCAGTLVLAGTTGWLRMRADRHYLSDVLVGAAVGFGLGIFLPQLLNPLIESETSTSVALSAQAFEVRFALP